jgi:hypothetical protein
MLLSESNYTYKCIFWHKYNVTGILVSILFISVVIEMINFIQEYDFIVTEFGSLNYLEHINRNKSAVYITGGIERSKV